MTLLKMGDRGPAVGQLQQLLGGKPSKLPRLNPDGIFGLKTQTRVIEFQKDNGLTPDGIAGILAMGKLQGGGGSPSRDVELQNAMNTIASLLNPQQRPDFLIRARSLVPVGNPNLLGAVQSSRKADQEMAREWEKRFERLKESIKGKPVEVQTAETLKEAKQRGRDVVKRVQEDREKCLKTLDAKKLIECGPLLKILDTALQSLLEKLIKPLGGGITAETLAKGIAFSINAVFEAARAVATCTKCDI